MKTKPFIEISRVNFSSTPTLSTAKKAFFDWDATLLEGYLEQRTEEKPKSAKIKNFSKNL